MQNPTKIEECKQNSIGCICCFEFQREVLGGLFLWGQHHIVWVSARTNILKYKWCTPEGKCRVHDSPVEEEVERRTASRCKINILLFNASSSIVDADMKMFSRQTLSLEESGSWGKSLSLGWWKEFMKEAFQEKKMEPCQGDQEWARYFEIITSLME